MQYYFPKISPTSYMGRAYSVVDELNGGKTNDDNAYSIRLIIQSIKTEYAHVLREELLRRFRNGESPAEQTYTDYKIDITPTDECGLVCGGTVKVKKAALPKIAEYGGSMLIRDVRAGMTQVIRATSLADAKSRVKPTQGMPNFPVYYISSGYIYVFLPARMQGITCIWYSAVIEDPAVPGACFSVLDEFPMTDYLWSITKARVKQFSGELLLNTFPRRDKVNNGEPESA